jgi:hypothetical protein
LLAQIEGATVLEIAEENPRIAQDIPQEIVQNLDCIIFGVFMFFVAVASWVLFKELIIQLVR